jgi:hypothetical protein
MTCVAILWSEGQSDRRVNEVRQIGEGCARKVVMGNVHVALYGGKESLQPSIRRRVRKIANEDLDDGEQEIFGERRYVP